MNLCLFFVVNFKNIDFNPLKEQIFANILKFDADFFQIYSEIRVKGDKINRSRVRYIE